MIIENNNYKEQVKLLLSYYANEISSNVIIAGQQHITREWWIKVLPFVDGYISKLVLEEISKGSNDQSLVRLDAIKSLQSLPDSSEVDTLARNFIKKLSLPKKGEIDAFHLAIAIVNEVDFILSWNCKHIANAFKFPLINKIKNNLGYQKLITICTPSELMEI